MIFPPPPYSAGDVWTYRMDDSSSPSPDFPLLSLVKRGANALWSSDFQTPPMMWSEAEGYWGIGKNTTSNELVSLLNGTSWKPGEVLLHPKGGGSPSGLVICWTAPQSLQIDLSYTLGRASPHGNGIGYEILRRTSGGDTRLVALQNTGSSLANEFTGMQVARGGSVACRVGMRTGRVDSSSLAPWTAAGI